MTGGRRRLAVIDAIPHEDHRYETAGDYVQQADGSWYLMVSRLSDPRYEFLLALHEFIECFACHFAGIAEPDIAAFDLMYEHERAAGKHSAQDEPGFDPRSPYREQHAMADSCERMVAGLIGVDWDAYDAEVTALQQGP